jgi:hypothetical protein
MEYVRDKDIEEPSTFKDDLFRFFKKERVILAILNQTRLYWYE